MSVVVGSFCFPRLSSYRRRHSSSTDSLVLGSEAVNENYEVKYIFDISRCGVDTHRVWERGQLHDLRIYIAFLALLCPSSLSPYSLHHSLPRQSLLFLGIIILSILIIMPLHLPVPRIPVFLYFS